MKMTKSLKSLFVFILCFVLITAMALFTVGCKTNKDDDILSSSPASSVEKAENVLGEGKTSFDFSVTYANGTTDTFVIKTDKKTVGDALLALELIKGEEGAYGLYVKTVNGVTLDFDKDQMYWAFYEDGAYAMAGVDSTEIKSGVKYSFKAEK